MQDVLKTLQLLSSLQRLTAKGKCVRLLQLVTTYLFTETSQLWNLINVIMEFIMLLQEICTKRVTMI